MDLLQTVRKEGSRGGRTEFSWSDVQSSAQRESYLGHSLMAPVGRWQKGKDLNWYAKADDETEESLGAEEVARRKDEARRVEVRKIKEREEDEMRKALGLEPLERGEGNVNLMPLGGAGGEGNEKEMGVVRKAVKEALGGEGEDEGAEVDKVKGRDRERRRRSSRSRSRERRHRKRDKGGDDRPRRRRSRSRDREREHRRHRSRSRDHHRSRRDDREREHRPRREEKRERSRDGERRRHRTRSPDERRDREKNRERDQRRRYD